MEQLHSHLAEALAGTALVSFGLGWLAGRATARVRARRARERWHSTRSSWQPRGR